MRKADYAALAAIIAKKRADMSTALKHSLPSDRCAHLVISSADQAARDIAEDFTRVASVDRHQFLKACGIDS